MPEFICSVFSLSATIVIAFIQIYQSKRMEVFERRQDERDERRPPKGIRHERLSSSRSITPTEA